MKLNRRLLVWILILGFGLGLAGLALAWTSGEVRRIDDPETALREAWQRARSRGGYRFNANLEQTSIPLALPENVGWQSKSQSVFIQGGVYLPAKSMNFRLWTGETSVADPSSSREIRIENGKAQARQGDGAWKSIEDISWSMAPGGDMMGFLAGVKNVRAVSNDPSTQDGTQPARLGEGRWLQFEMDGAKFTAYIRQQYLEQLQSSGKLPPGLQIQTSQQMAAMTGWGEVFIGADGLPQYQHIRLELPPESREAQVAELEVTFSDFAEPDITAASLIFGNPRVQQSIWMAIALGLLGYVLLLARRSKTAYAAVIITIIASMVISPLIQDVKAGSWMREQAQREAAQDEQEKQTQAQERVTEQFTNPQMQPNTSPMESASRRAEIANQLASTSSSVTTGMSSAAIEARLVTIAKSGLPAYQAGPSTPLPEELQPYVPAASFDTSTCTTVLDSPQVDSDRDGLSDCQEHFLGTSATIADTDGDTITDTVEVQGFSMGGKQWYGDPLRPDSNADGVDDSEEWNKDSDNDGVPDLWALDNDSDNVPDEKDLSVSTADSHRFTRESPLSMVINGLNANRLIYVDFQLRPTNPDHLNYTYNVFKWPYHDAQGQMADLDGKTYKDVYPKSDSTSDSNGDVKMLPMLEIRMDNKSNHLPDAFTLKQYGVSTQTLTKDGSQIAAYIPLQLISDKGGKKVAFSTRVPYQSSDSWGAAQQVRMAWIVQGLTDTCAKDGWKDNLCQKVDKYNQPTILAVYYDEFNLSGLRVQENQGSDWAMIYKDTNVLPKGSNMAQQINRLDPLADLALGLDVTFLAGRTVTDTSGVVKNDMTLQDIRQRFDHVENVKANIPVTPTRFNISKNYLNVDLKSYSHPDLASYTIAQTETKQILNQYYTPYWKASEPITPTMLFANVNRIRSLNLDVTRQGYTNISWQGNQVTMLVSESAPKDRGLLMVPLFTQTDLKWSPYAFIDNAWTGAPAENYLDSLKKIYPQSEISSDADVARIGMLMIQMYYANMYQGVVNQIAYGSTLINSPLARSDAQVAGALSDPLPEALKLVVNLSKTALGIQGNVRSGSKDIQAIYSYLKVMKIALDNGVLSQQMSNLLHNTANGSNGRTVVEGLSLKSLFAMFDSLFFALTLVGMNQTLSKVLAKIVMVVLLIAGVYMKIIQPIVLIYKTIKLYKIFGTFWGVWKNVSKFSWLKHIGMNLLITAVFAALTLITAIIFIETTGIQWGSVQANMIFAQVLGLIIVFIIGMILSMIPVIGNLLAILFSVIDMIIGWITGKSIAEYITDYLYSADATANFDTKTGGSDMGIDNPDLGFVVGNTLKWSFNMTTTAIQSNPDRWQTKFAIGLGYDVYNKSVLPNTSVHWKLAPEKQDQVANWGDMYYRWGPMSLDHIYHSGWGKDVYMYRTDVADPLATTGIPLSQSGINVTVTARLNTGYSLPIFECWTVIFVPVCKQKHLDGKDSLDAAVGVFDVFPATIDEFSGWKWSKNALAPLPTPKDHDNDGLISRDWGGNDPNDEAWDTDGDGLSDSYEIYLRSLPAEKGGAAYNPYSADTDGDGLNDGEESRWGSDPANRDTDSDGLTDLDEVQGFDFVYGQDGGGQNLVTRIFSNPIADDGDHDGINDGVERRLYNLGPIQNPYNPRAWNVNPLVVSLKPDTGTRGNFVAPGWVRPITMTSSSLLQTPILIHGWSSLDCQTGVAIKEWWENSSRYSIIPPPHSINLGLDAAPNAPYVVRADLIMDEDKVTRPALVSGYDCGNVMGPLMYLPFEEPSGSQVFTNTLSKQYHATCSGGSCPDAGVQGAPGHGNGLRFPDSTRGLQVQDTGSAEFEFDNYSFALWAYPQIGTKGTLVERVGDTNGYRVSMDLTGSEPRVNVFIKAKGNLPPEGVTWPYCPVSQGLPWNANGWNHLAVVWPYNSPVLYVNGAGVSLPCPGTLAAELDSPDLTDAGNTMLLGTGAQSGYTGLADEFYFYPRALRPSEVTLLAKKPFLADSIEGVSPEDMCDLQVSSGVTLTIDADPPTSTITSLNDGQYLNTTGVYILGGTAKDPTSYIGEVYLSIDGAPWEKVNGLESWSYAWDIQRKGWHTLQSKAVDAVGNEEINPKMINIYIDRSGPDIEVTPTAIQAAGLDALGNWIVPLAGRAADGCSGIQSVEVLMQAAHESSGNGWQQAILQSSVPGACQDVARTEQESDGADPDENLPEASYTPWSIDYSLPHIGNDRRALTDPSGVYTAQVRGRDNLGNYTLPGHYVTTTVRVDATPPIAYMTSLSPTIRAITRTIQVHGVISDAGKMPSGVAALEAAFMPAETAVVADKAALRLSLDEPAGLQVFRDVSGHGNHATCKLPACPQSGQVGKIDLAASFDGVDDLIDLGRYASTQITAAVTLAGWFNTTAQDPGFVVGRWSQAHGGAYGIYFDDTGLNFAVQNANGLELRAFTGSKFNSGTWHHVVGVWDGKTARLYVDGSKLNEITDASIGALADPAIPFTIGGNSPIPGMESGTALKYFQGKLDEITLFPVALNDNQVMALYRRGDVTWLPVKIDQPGQILSSWTMTIPVGLDGVYEIDLRGTDVAGNRNMYRMEWITWHGEIDTQAPVVRIQAHNQGRGIFRVEGWASDFNLLDTIKFPCDPRQIEKTMYNQVSDWYRDWFSNTNHLLSMHLFDCSANGSGHFTMQACDRYGHCSQSTSSPSPDEYTSLTGNEAGPFALVIQPMPDSTINNLQPLSLTVSAQAPETLQAVTVTVDGGWIHTFDFSASGVTDTVSSTVLTPPLDWPEGQHIFTAMASDAAGNIQNPTWPTTVTLDLQPPVIDITPLLLTTTHQLPGNGVVVGGTVSDTVGVRRVEASVGGSAWETARVEDGRWQLDWYPNDAPDGVSYPVIARATDWGGHVVTASADVTVDIVPLSPVTVTVSYLNSQGTEVLLQPGQTVDDSSVQALTVRWSSSQEPITEYLVGYSHGPIPVVNNVIQFVPGNDLRYDWPVEDTQVYYAHVAVEDTHGNLTWSSIGPFIVDQPPTPTFFPLGKLPSIGRIYRGWMNNGCSDLGVDRSIATMASNRWSLKDEQRLSAAWDGNGLRLAYQGADWDTDGDLFILLGVGQPVENTPVGEVDKEHPIGDLGYDVDLPFFRTHMIWVKDEHIAQLLEWDGNQWQVLQEALPGWAYNLSFDYSPQIDNGMSITDLYLPYAWLGIDDPANTSLNLIALASRQGLNKPWAVFPPNNPHNSEFIQGGVEITTDLHLRNAYHWDNLAPGVCPNQTYPDVDLLTDIEVFPGGLVTETRVGELYLLTSPGFGAYPPVGNGQSIEYRIHVANDGMDAADDVWLRLQGRGALRLPGGTPTNQGDLMEVSLGELAAGGSKTITVTAETDISKSGGLTLQDMNVIGRLEVSVFPSRPTRSQPVEQLAVQHVLDVNAPIEISLRQASGIPGVAHSGLVEIQGQALDESSLQMAEGQLRDPQGELHALTCSNLSKTEWSCFADLRAALDGQVYAIRSRVADQYGNISQWSDWLDILVDRQTPTIALDTTSQKTLSNILAGGQVILSGIVKDNYQASGVEVCKGPLRGLMDYVVHLPLALGQATNHGAPSPLQGQEYCERVDLLPGFAASGNWIYSMTGPPGVDNAAQELQLYGLDAAGNRTTDALRYTLHVDTVPPSVITTTSVTTISLAAYQAEPFPILTGNAQDGSGNLKLVFYLSAPDGSYGVAFWSGVGEWIYQPLLEHVGQYTLIIEATDRAGNTSYKVSKFEVQP